MVFVSPKGDKMPARPTWSGSLQISLVSITVKIFPATNPGKQVEFHQIDRKTHKRVHHQNVDEGGEVEKADLVKGFEYAKNKYIEIDPEDLKALRLLLRPPCQSGSSSRLKSCRRGYLIGLISSLRKMKFRQRRSASCEERSRRQTLWTSERSLFSGREQLVAIGAPPDPKQKGLMLYVLRYEDELRNPKSILSDVKEAAVDADELSLAKQLINGRSSKFDLSAYKNDYEAAVKKLVDAKRKGKPLPEPEPANTKVVNIMDALRSSLEAEKKPKTTAKAKKTTRRPKAA
jgi:DNA end-binding protein Ku